MPGGSHIAIDPHIDRHVYTYMYIHRHSIWGRRGHCVYTKEVVHPLCRARPKGDQLTFSYKKGL